MDIPEDGSKFEYMGGGGGTLCIELWLPFLVGVEKGLSLIRSIGV